MHAQEMKNEVQIHDISIARKLYSTDSRIGVVQYDEGMYGKQVGYYNTLKRRGPTQVPNIRA